MQVVDGASADRRDDDLPRRFATTMAYGLPPGAVLMTSGNSSAFVWTYLDVVERRAPDAVLMHRVLLGHDHEKLRLDASAGGFESATGLPWVEGLRSRPLDHLGGLKRPFFLEVREPDLERLDGLNAHGLVARWGGLPAPEVEAIAASALAELEARSAVLDPSARGVLAQSRESASWLRERGR